MHNLIELIILFFKFTYNNQSTAIMNETCSVGRPTVESTISMVTRAALGTLATPIDVAVEAKLTERKEMNRKNVNVKLKKKHKKL